MSRTAICFGMSPSLKKRSATPCWVAMMSSVIGPTLKADRLAAIVWMGTAVGGAVAYVARPIPIEERELRR